MLATKKVCKFQKIFKKGIYKPKNVCYNTLEIKENIMTEKEKKALGYNIDKTQLLKVMDASDEYVCNRYLTQDPSAFVPSTMEFDEKFHKVLNKYDYDENTKQNFYEYDNVRLCQGICLDFFFSKLKFDVFPLLPADYNLDLPNILHDLNEVLGQNRDEIRQATFNRKNKTPTRFFFNISNTICDIIIDKAIQYACGKISNK